MEHRAPGLFHGRPGLQRPADPAAAGLSLAWEAAGAARRVTLTTAEGDLAAEGRVVVVDGVAIYDRIATQEAHSRRGLGSAVMAALGARARAEGARSGLLNATAAGRALYMALGWRLVSPYATALIRR